MIRTLSAHTGEIDDVDGAVQDLLGQLDVSRLLRHSAGILYYYGDFAQTGVVKKLCEALPFPVVGGTTSNSSVSGSGESIALTLMVLTSDDAAFTAGVSGPLQSDPYPCLEALYQKILAEKPPGVDKPALIFISTPRILSIVGDDYLAALRGLSGGAVPIFGAAAHTHHVDFSDVKTLFNGTEYDDSLVLLVFWGCRPRFFLSVIPEEQILNHRAIITDSYRHRIKKINGVPATRYMESIGLAKNGKLTAIDAFPLILHLSDGPRLVRTIYADEDGELLCSGAVPAHITMEISFCNREFVLESARKVALECAGALKEQAGESHPALIISCAARRLTLGSGVFDEIGEIQKCLGAFPYLMAYSAGEFCPVPNNEGRLVNYFFNYSLCMCVL
ncbi:MAG: FIST C-terminal domain-containing protein [Treponema sp.]|jgi:hypothetical protein|nr:FIST C-terminal domain-containing protein [Treponema sp.]